MPVAKIIELSAESREGFDHAVKLGLEKATTTINNVRSVWIKDQEVVVNNGRIDGFRVHMKVTFELD